MDKLSIIRLIFLFMAVITLSSCVVAVKDDEDRRRHGEYGDYDEHHGEHHEHHEEHDDYGGYH